MLDNERDVLGSLLIWRGHSYNSVVRSELERARDDAIAIKPESAGIRVQPGESAADQR